MSKTAQERNDYVINPALAWTMRLRPQELQAFWRKELAVPDNGFLVVEKGNRELKVIDTGGVHTVGGLADSLLHPFKSRITWIGVMQERETSFEMRFPNLCTADGQLAAASWLVSLTISQADTFYRELLCRESIITRSELAARLQGRLHQRLQGALRSFALEDLERRRQAGTSLSQEMAVALKPILSSWGMQVSAAQPLRFISMAVMAERQELLADLRQRLRETAASESIDTARTELQVREKVHNLLQEARLNDLLREEEATDLRRNLQEAGLEEAVQKLEAAIGTDRPSDHSRGRAFLARIEALGDGASADATAGGAKDVGRGLGRLVKGLRYAGGVLYWGTLLLALLWPNIFPKQHTPRLVTTITGFVLATCSLVSAYWVDLKIGRMRIKSLSRAANGQVDQQAFSQAEQRLGREICRLLDALVSNVELAKNRLLRSGARELAAEARRAEQDARNLAKRSQALAVATQRRELAAADLEDILDTDEKVWGLTEHVSSDSEELRETVNSGRHQETELVLERMARNLQRLENWFDHRQRIAS